MENPRECALDVLIKVDKKEELSHIAISNVLEKYQFSEKRDRAFFTRLVEGTLERQITSHGNLPDPLHGSGTRFSSM